MSNIHFTLVQDLQQHCDLLGFPPRDTFCDASGLPHAGLADLADIQLDEISNFQKIALLRLESISGLLSQAPRCLARSNHGKEASSMSKSLVQVVALDKA